MRAVSSPTPEWSTHSPGPAVNVTHLLTSMDAGEGVGQKSDVHVTRMSMSVGFMRSFSSSLLTAPPLKGGRGGGIGGRSTRAERQARRCVH